MPLTSVGYCFFPLPQSHDLTIGKVVLVNVADVLNGFLADILGRNIFDVAEPNVRIESLRLSLLAKLSNAGRTCVVGSKCE